MRAALQHILAAAQHTRLLLAMLCLLVQWSSRPARALWLAAIAAPPGRTLATGGWGCIMVTLSTTVSAFEVPSGQALEFQESFYERQEGGELWARFRFIAPAIGENMAYADVADDFMVLCEKYALPSLADQDTPDQIIISLADRATEFGVTNREATQYFEAFRLKDAACIWEGF